MKKLSIIVAIALLAVLAVALPVAAEGEPPEEVWVCAGGECGHPGAQFSSIQDAITAVAEGGTVHVAAGEYTENPSMTKPVNLEGPAEGDRPTVKGTLTLLSGASGARIEKVNFLAMGAADSIVLKGVNGVTIANCAFDGANQFLSGGRAVQMSGPSNNVTIERCTFTNGYYVTIQGSVNNLTVRNSTITNVKSGINLQAGSNLVVENTDISVIAQGEENDTYCVRFASSTTTSSGDGMRLAGGTYTVDKAGLTAAEPDAYHSAIIVRSGATGALQANWLSIDGEVVNLSTTELDAGYNYWGPEGPGQPAGRVVGSVTTDNWLSPESMLEQWPDVELPELSVDAPDTSSETGLVEAKIMLDPGDFDVFGFQFTLTYDPGVLNLGAVSRGAALDALAGQNVAGGYSWKVDTTESGKIKVWVSLLDNGSPGNLPGLTAQSELVKVSFTASPGGTCGTDASLQLLDEILTRKEDGARIHPVTTVGDSVTVYKMVPVSGVVELQGRNMGKWNGAVVSLTGGPIEYPPITTTSNGAWSANVACGTYDVYVDMNAYLDAQKPQLGEATSTYDAGTVKLLGGNADENTPNIIFLEDVVAIANVIGVTPAPDQSAQNKYPDINADNTINILDLVLAGINYTETGPKSF